MVPYSAVLLSRVITPWARLCKRMSRSAPLRSSSSSTVDWWREKYCLKANIWRLYHSGFSASSRSSDSESNTRRVGGGRAAARGAAGGGARGAAAGGGGGG